MIIGALVWGLALLRLKCRSEVPVPIFQPASTALCLALVGGWMLSPRLYVYDWILAWPLLLAAWKYGPFRLRQVIAWCHPLFGFTIFSACCTSPSSPCSA